MTDFLVFTLYAPMASWGDIAPGEQRGSWDRPSRSAVLGLLGAALQVERTDQPAHDALDREYGVAVSLDREGGPAVDYHTVQTLPAAIMKRIPIHTRQAHLAQPLLLETALTQRAYRHDSLTRAAVWARVETPRWPLTAMASALERPGFVLYAGRKSHALGLPTAPFLVAAATLADALKARSAIPDGLRRFIGRLIPAPSTAIEVSHDPCVGFPSGLVSIRRETRRDEHANRTRWQFQERFVEVGLLREEPQV